VQRRALYEECKYMYSDMPKGTSWADKMSNRKKNKPVALAIVCLKASGSYSGI